MARVLVIEDDEKIAQSLKRGLQVGGHAVDYLLDGQSGERRLETHRKEYDLAIVDLMLPQKDGFEVVRGIREKNMMLPILVLTARQTTEDKVRALDAGADDYLTKPFSTDELLARVRALLRRPDQSLPPRLEVNGLQLDTSTREVLYNGQEIQLSLKEFSLLEYFMRHPNQALSREQIYDQLWDFAANYFSNVVDAQVKNLRKKLEDKGTDQFVETVHGVGYRFKVNQA